MKFLLYSFRNACVGREMTWSFWYMEFLELLIFKTFRTFFNDLKYFFFFFLLKINNWQVIVYCFEPIVWTKKKIYLYNSINDVVIEQSLVCSSKNSLFYGMNRIIWSSLKMYWSIYHTYTQDYNYIQYSSEHFVHWDHTWVWSYLVQKVSCYLLKILQ